MTTGSRSVRTSAALAAVVAAAGLAAAAQPEIKAARGKVWAETAGQELVTLPDGAQEQVETTTIIRPMCGSEPIDADRFAEIVATHNAIHADLSDFIVVDTPVIGRRTGIDIQFNLGGSVPAAAIVSFQQAEAYIENFFSDPITINVSVGFSPLGSGVIGATGNNDITRSYTDFRAAAVADADADDTLQAALPVGSGLPVRFNASSSSVTSESTIRISRGNAKALGLISPTGGADASMTYNSQFNFDFDPTNGVGNRLSLVDTIVHEVGHAMGFVSAVDFGNGTFVQPMDAIRFVRTGTFDPQSIADFSTLARSVDFNNPNGNHTLDVISSEYRAEDGTPFQASHFREQGTNIGIMDAAGASGETFVNRQPFGYYTQADLDVFDFIGFDLFDCEAPAITTEPQPQQVCEGSEATLTVVAPDAVEFQWFQDGVELEDGFFFSGTNTDTLTVLNISGSAAGLYSVRVANSEGCTSTSGTASISSFTPPQITSQPSPLTVDQGDSAQFVVGTPLALGFQWFKDGQPLANGGGISGVTSNTLTIASAAPADAGAYSCEILGLAGCVTTSSPASLTVNAVSNACNLADIAAPLGVLDLGDIDAFILAFSTSNAAADLVAPFGVVDLSDIDAFISAFTAGCP